MDARPLEERLSFRLDLRDHPWEDLATQIYHWDVYKTLMEKSGKPRAKYLSLAVGEWFTGRMLTRVKAS